MNLLHVNQYFSTARERYLIRIRRDEGRPREEWTDDPHFKEWRFCNVFREHDRTTQWFRDEIRSQLHGLAAVEATIIFRWFNRIETGEIVKDLLLEGWNTEEARRRLEDVRPIVTGAYMIKTVNGMNKLDGMLWAIDNALPQIPEMVYGWQKEHRTLQQAHRDLMEIDHLGHFMSYEVVSDLRWTDVLDGAPDIMTWANAGPGCFRGLGRVVDGDRRYFTQGMSKSERGPATVGLMQHLLALSQDGEYWPKEWEPWEMREVEHWACEFDKYKRAEAGDALKRRFKLGE